VSKRALGKGLDSLIQQYEEESESSFNEGVTEVQIKLVIPNPDQPRKTFDEESLKEL